MLIVVHYCYRFLCTVVTDSCALLLPFFVHSPYHFLCTRDFCLQSSHEGRTQGYVGAEAGIGIDYAMGGSVFFNGAVELGLVVNFQKVSLDIGLRGQFMPPYAIDCFFLPIRIGFVF